MTRKIFALVFAYGFSSAENPGMKPDIEPKDGGTLKDLGGDDGLERSDDFQTFRTQLYGFAD